MRLLALAAVGVLALAVSAAAATWPSPHTLGPYAYVSPAPGSALHMPGTTIIVRPGGNVVPGSLRPGLIHASGSVSGDHDGTLRLSDDGKTVVFHPTDSFALGESVSCTIHAGIRTAEAGDLPAASFWFRTFSTTPPGPTPGASQALADLAAELEASAIPSGAAEPTPPLLRSRSDTLPPDFPAIMATAGEGAGAGALFLSSIAFGVPDYKSYLMILDNDGDPLFYRRIEGTALDFKVQPCGLLTYFDGSAGKFYALNSHGAVVDSFAMANGYYTDLHELRLLPDGHALLMSYDGRAVDMSAMVDGGDPNAVVTGLVVQELDRSKDVVFQWRSWDHFRITDAVGVDLTASTVDYAHGNAIEQEPDGNLLLSSRHMDEITKISRDDGHILWRWGGKNNEFTFVNDPDRFSHQHSIRRLANGHLMLFDNGNLHTPPYSRAAEYELDESTKTATLVWQYRTDPDTYGFAMGSVERLANGNTVIGWGSTSPALTEVTPSGDKAEEIRLPDGVFSYRAYRYAWPPSIAVSVAFRNPRIDVASAGPDVALWIRPDPLFFPADSVDPASLRLRGTIAASSVGPVDPERGFEARFPLAPLLAYLHSGRERVEITGALVSGEWFRVSADLEIVGEKRVAARMASPIGASPLRIAFRSDGASPRTVTMSAWDIHGRRVRRWTATIEASGETTWDGRGQNGERLASGIYFVGTDGGAIDEMARVVLLK